MITDAEDTRAITSFIAWTAWTGVARRPGKTYSYTNNWPPEELVGNTLTGDAIMWSALSLVTLLGGSGLVLGLTAAIRGSSAGTRPRSGRCGSCRRTPWP